ncbi:MAG: hypothetical protein Q8K65_08330 [Alphaproteobacteria bacterium]|nr:hypothetical protein [Alphaproteobacteria bacterium]
MKPEDIPKFIYRGAIIDVDGQEQTVRDFCLARKDRHPLSEEILVIQTKSGDIVEYDPMRVQEVHGRAPDFIRVGAEIFWRETRSDMTKYNGVWTVESYEVGKDPIKGDPHTKVELSLAKRDGSKSTYLRRAFNAETMYPVKPDAQPGRLAHILQRDISVLKPATIRRTPPRKP